MSPAPPPSPSGDPALSSGPEASFSPPGGGNDGGTLSAQWRLGLPLSAALLLLLVTGLVGFVADRSWIAAFRQAEQVEVDELSATYADALLDALQRRAQLTHGLRAYVATRWNSPTFASEFPVFARNLREELPGARAVQLVRGGRIVLVEPVAGNEAAVGLDLYQHPDARIPVDVRRSEREDGIIMSGPLPLVQGGTGIIARRRVMDGDSLIGIGQIVFDAATIVEEAEAVGGVPGLLTALRDADGQPVAGPDEIFDRDPVLTRVRLPDRVWTLAAVPSAGWGPPVARVVIYRSGFALLALVLAGIAWVMTDRRVEAVTASAVRSRVKAEEKFRRLFQLTPDGVSLTRARDGLLLEVNESLAAMTGWSREEMLGSTSTELGLWGTPGEREAVLARLRGGEETVDHEGDMRCRDGTRVRCSFMARVVEVDGEPCVLAVIRDVERQRTYEQRLAQSQKLEAIGRLAGGIAHDFNNIITAILGYNQAVADELDATHPVQDDLRQVRQAAERAAALTRQLLTFSRGQVSQPRPLALNPRIQDTANLLNRLLGEDIRLVLDLAPDLPLVRLDPTQLERALVNLAVNARDAMPAGGTIYLETRRAEDGVELQVRDTGTGIPPELQAKIFEPFFTTKEAGRGAGLGLSAVYAIVRDAGGRLEVSSRVGEGAAFRIWLPALPPDTEPDPVPAPAPSPAALPRGTETVLLAEDEPQIRDLATRTLESLGYRVLAAENGRALLLRDASHTGPVGLLLTDVIMPGMSGPDLALEVRRRHPGLPVLYMSGYTADTRAIDRAMQEGGRMLPKPFTVAELAREVRLAIDRGRTG